jgi:hypothetical protein
MNMDIVKYADWTKGQVLLTNPADRVRTDWIVRWRITLDALIQADAIFEVLSVVAARWEFLGGLFSGVEGDTGAKDAIAYVNKFLVAINPAYRDIHDISGLGNPGSEFFSIFRNKPFHGGTPAAILLKNRKDLVGWKIGCIDATCAANHLQIKNDVIYVEGQKFVEEFMLSLNSYADYLEANTEQLGGRLPVARWQRGFWARFKPQNMSASVWMQEGVSRGIQ